MMFRSNDSEEGVYGPLPQLSSREMDWAIAHEIERRMAIPDYELSPTERVWMALKGNPALRALWSRNYMPEYYNNIDVGRKDDDDKPMMDLLDPDFLVEVAKVMTFGAKKYAPNNWRKGIDASRLFAAALRHLTAYWGGQDNDPETGLSHLAHATCCLMFLWWITRQYPNRDDRYTVSGGQHETNKDARR